MSDRCHPTRGSLGKDRENVIYHTFSTLILLESIAVSKELVVGWQVSPVNLIWARKKKSAGRKGIIGFLFQNTPGVLVLLPLACRCPPTSEKGLGDRKSAGVVF
jgi:hypothetical protein